MAAVGPSVHMRLSCSRLARMTHTAVKETKLISMTSKFTTPSGNTDWPLNETAAMAVSSGRGDVKGGFGDG